jgi:hypothetical protein
MEVFMRDFEEQGVDGVDSQNSPVEEQVLTAEVPAVESDPYLRYLAAIELFRAEGDLDSSPLQTVLRLSAADCFEVQLHRSEDARNAKRESDARLGPENLALDHLGLKAARQGAQMVQVMERAQRKNDTPPKG